VWHCYVCTFFHVSPSSFQEGCPLRCFTTVVMPYTIQKPLLCYEWTLLWYVYDTMTLMVISDLQYQVSRAGTQLRCVGTVYSDLAVPRPCYYTKACEGYDGDIGATQQECCWYKGPLVVLLSLVKVEAVRSSCI
jgi:hypothetical protein